MSLEKDQGFRDRGTGGDKVGRVSRRRKKAERQVGREDFSKPWAEADKKSSRDKRGGDWKKKRRHWRCRSHGATFLWSLLQSGLLGKSHCQENRGVNYLVQGAEPGLGQSQT